jgi:hypothetical protein
VFVLDGRTRRRRGDPRAPARTAQGCGAVERFGIQRRARGYQRHTSARASGSASRSIPDRYQRSRPDDAPAGAGAALRHAATAWARARQVNERRAPRRCRSSRCSPTTNDRRWLAIPARPQRLHPRPAAAHLVVRHPPTAPVRRKASGHRVLRPRPRSTGSARATIARRLCTVAGFDRYAVDEDLLDHSPAAHVRRPRLDHESHATALDATRSVDCWSPPGSARQPSTRSCRF